MAKRVVFVCTGLLFVAGCFNNEPMPQIVTNYPPSTVSPRHSAAAPVRTYPRVDTETPNNWSPLTWIPERNWNAIIIHHSASRAGNAAIFDNWHREGRGWDGVGYDFVIGNGTDSGDGAVEVTNRWRYQKVGAHTGGTPGNWANEKAVGICLVGDFNRTAPTRAQLQSLARLIDFLQNRYDIPKNRIFGHGTTPGGHSTDCPGRRFPMAELKAILD